LTGSEKIRTLRRFYLNWTLCWIHQLSSVGHPSKSSNFSKGKCIQCLKTTRIWKAEKLNLIFDYIIEISSCSFQRSLCVMSGCYSRLRVWWFQPKFCWWYETWYKNIRYIIPEGAQSSNIMTFESFWENQEFFLKLLKATWLGKNLIGSDCSKNFIPLDCSISLPCNYM